MRTPFTIKTFEGENRPQVQWTDEIADALHNVRQNWRNAVTYGAFSDSGSNRPVMSQQGDIEILLALLDVSGVIYK